MHLDKKSGLMAAIVLFFLLTWVVGGLFYSGRYIESEHIPKRGISPPQDTTGDRPPSHAAMIKQFLVAGIFSFITLALVGTSIIYLFEDMDKFTLQIIVGSAALIVFIALLFSPLDICAFTTMPERTVLGEISPSGDGIEPDETTSTNMIFMLLIFLLPLSYIIIREFWSAYSKKEEHPRVKKDVRSTIERTLDELYDGRDVQSTILRCYTEMSFHLEEKGVKERTFFTPREFRANALKKLSLTDRSISALTQIFEEARYSDHLMGEVDKLRAINSLKRLKKELDENNT